MWEKSPLKGDLFRDGVGESANGSREALISATEYSSKRLKAVASVPPDRPAALSS
jgi:hypothetical protein